MISFAFHKWSSSLIIAAAGSSLWMTHQIARITSQYDALRGAESWVSATETKQAQEAFDAGDFREAAALLEPSGLSGKDDRDLEFLQARTLECVGRFTEAAEAYRRAGAHPNAPALAERSRAFCLRMASDRRHAETPSHETLYRLHEEFMRRQQYATARNVARQLLPDTEPLRASALALLQAVDERASVKPSKQAGRLDVTLTAAAKAAIDQLQGLPIETLTVTSAGLQDSAVFSGLKVHSLHLNSNPLSDIAALRSMPLQSLDLSNTQVADVRALAGLPLRELNLSHSNVTFLLPLSLCPLERLSLAGLPIRNIQDLRLLALHQLDLSHTQVSDLSPLSSLPLDELNLDGTLVRDLRPLSGSHIKNLTLAHTAVTDLSPISGLPLVELDLRGCDLLADLQPLANCPQLERILLPRHLKVPADHWGLAKLKIIDFEQRIVLAKR